MDFSITAATIEGGGPMLVSFGSGNEGGRLQARARGRARVGNASPAEVRSVRARANRIANAAGPRSRQRREARRILQEIQDNTTNRGRIRRGVLADIAADLADLT